MKTSLFLTLSLGLIYLFILEDVGNFFSLNMEQFKKEIQEQKFVEESHDPKLKDVYNPDWILRTPTDLLLERQRDKFTTEEKQYIKEQIVQFQHLTNNSIGEGFYAKIDTQQLVYDNFYKRVVADVIAKRKNIQ